MAYSISVFENADGLISAWDGRDKQWAGLERIDGDGLALMVAMSRGERPWGFTSSGPTKDPDGDIVMPGTLFALCEEGEIHIWLDDVGDSGRRFLGLSTC